MPGRITGELAGGTASPDSQSYEPGTLSYDHLLVEEIISRGSSLTLGTHDAFSALIRSEVPRQLLAEGFDHDAFLDALVSAAVMNDGGGCWIYLDVAVSKSIQALYDAGIPSFTVTAPAMPRYTWFIRDLAGREDRQLDVRCVGAFYELGTRLTHARLTVEGSAYRVGAESTSSEFMRDGPSSSIRKAGQWARGCVFQVGDAEAVTATLHWEGGSLAIATTDDCTYYVDREISRPDLLELDAAHFFHSRNRLLVPDGAGSWKEVLP